MPIAIGGLVVMRLIGYCVVKGYVVPHQATIVYMINIGKLDLPHLSPQFVHERGPQKGGHWYHKKVQIIFVIFDKLHQPTCLY